MPDVDLRRRALKSGKTTSNKAKVRSEQSSHASSKATSHANSRVQSRDVSDDEDGWTGGDLSDDAALRYASRRAAPKKAAQILPIYLRDARSINSADALLEPLDPAVFYAEELKERLSLIIERLLEWKGSAAETREANLRSYVNTLTIHHVSDVLAASLDNLLVTFGRSIKSEASQQEVLLALRAVALTAISIPSDEIYDKIGSLLKRTISDSQSFESKAAAIHTLGICMTFGGVDETEMADTLTFLQEIVSSDGSFIGADDNAEVVVAALHNYALLATQVEDLEDVSEDAVETFLDQLNSGDARVQIAAGEVIALLFEKSFTPREEDDTQSDFESSDPDSDDNKDNIAGDTSLVKRYNAYHDAGEVLSRVNALASISGRSLNKHDKKRLHQAFTSISLTVENPRVGLRTNKASRATIRIQKEGTMKVDKWWKLTRLNAIRRLLGGGFLHHYFEGNKQVLDFLPLILRGSDGPDSGKGSPSRRGKARAGDKHRDARRFVTAESFE